MPGFCGCVALELRFAVGWCDIVRAGCWLGGL